MTRRRSTVTNFQIFGAISKSMRHQNFVRVELMMLTLCKGGLADFGSCRRMKEREVTQTGAKGEREHGVVLHNSLVVSRLSTVFSFDMTISAREFSGNSGSSGGGGFAGTSFICISAISFLNSWISASWTSLEPWLRPKSKTPSCAWGMGAWGRLEAFLFNATTISCLMKASNSRCSICCSKWSCWHPFTEH
jgi:hypothetical protein